MALHTSTPLCLLLPNYHIPIPFSVRVTLFTHPSRSEHLQTVHWIIITVAEFNSELRKFRHTENNLVHSVPNWALIKTLSCDSQRKKAGKEGRPFWVKIILLANERKTKSVWFKQGQICHLIEGNRRREASGFKFHKPHRFHTGFSGMQQSWIGFMRLFQTQQ